MQILIVTQGQWGQRIANHIRLTAPAGWQVTAWEGPTALPIVLDDPEEFLPRALPPADLLLVLTESAGMTDLAPDMAARCGAQAVIVPVDRQSWAPPGLAQQVRQRLESVDVGSALPAPFCSLAPRKGQHPLIGEFARRFGRPELTCAVHRDRVTTFHPVRETPCGNTRYIVERLANVPAKEAAERAGLLHHYYPCWGGMETDPVRGSHTLLHIAATIAQKSVERAVRKARQADG